MRRVSLGGQGQAMSYYKLYYHRCGCSAYLLSRHREGRRICPWQFQFYIDNFEPDALVDFWHWNKKIDIVGGIPVNDHLRPEAGHRLGVKPTARGATIGNGSFVNFNADLTDGEFYVR